MFRKKIFMAFSLLCVPVVTFGSEQPVYSEEYSVKLRELQPDFKGKVEINVSQIPDQPDDLSILKVYDMGQLSGEEAQQLLKELYEIKCKYDIQECQKRWKNVVDEAIVSKELYDEVQKVPLFSFSTLLKLKKRVETIKRTVPTLELLCDSFNRSLVNRYNGIGNLIMYKLAAGGTIVVGATGMVIAAGLAAYNRWVAKKKTDEKRNAQEVVQTV
ncbi:hypothetical protein IPH25_01320 [bacterium]|nr:MAG: hypothetical protein IPG37_03445 [bacterium]QQR62067.1 MAG: hypothetical protein IPH25_01320 [bacterium]QQR62339.1 MAG: hypothetical protein IPH67_02815 [bacterium]